MEFAFEDDVFGSPRVRNLQAETSYNAKICESEWFITTTSDDPEENMMLQKYQGDYNYMKRDFRRACEDYGRCLNLAPKSATSVQRDCMEGMSRCCLNLGRYDEALKHAEVLETLSTNCDHRVAVWMLRSEVYNRTGNVIEESAALCRCLLVRPWTSNLWHRLSSCYLGLMGNTSDTSILAFKTGACLLKTRLLYQGALSGNQSFARARNLKALAEVEELVKNLELPREFIEQALNEFEKESEVVNVVESDEEGDSLLLLGMADAEVMLMFEERWFSWIARHEHNSGEQG
ncbi:hypothetical protein V5799_011320 [Amblyomma americanum]|uniref:Tetratricopeptide repeat protein n=1 Tax=Amblyomma americanum TaxID=6943 RepID=A0AAQ4EHK9_AMBAM